MQETATLDTVPHNTSSIDAPPERSAEIKLRLINLAAVTIPFIGFVVAFVLLWGVAFNWIYLALLVGMYTATAIGITVGYHRLFTHGSFKTPRPIVALLAILGSMAVEGPVLQWAAIHRCHHQHSDEHDDPHSRGTPTWVGCFEHLRAVSPGTRAICAKIRSFDR
jgi:stearoyl-CoA desaturase (delta-9 desaturase)